MALQSIRNHRGFFSDYWLGTVLGGRSAVGSRLTAAQTRKALERVARLVDSVAGAGEIELSRFRERFARPLLLDVFGFDLHDNAVEPRLRPLSVADGSGHFGAPVALLWLCNDAAELDARQSRRRLEDELLARNLDHGFLLSPEVLRLIQRPGLGNRGASFDLALGTLAELQDAESLSVAYRVLAAANFVPGPDGRRPIELLEAESRRHSARVSGDLKAAVFDAAERIVGGFLRDVRERAEELAPTPTLGALRDAGFLALYRLLFILYAEARDERLLAHRLYQRSYSLDSLVARLLARPVEQVPANRDGLWHHLLALFRIFNEGIRPKPPDLENIPPRGGRLFSDETPEGALLRRLRLDDRTVAQILLALATTRPRRGVGRERVSFRELDIEQLGNVYQGLLDYEPGEATQTLIECSVGGREMVLTADEMVHLVEMKSLVVRGEAAIVEGTAAARLHPDGADEDDDVDEAGDDDAEDAEAEDDEAAEPAVQRGATLKLMRRLEAGEFYFRPGSARKASGSYYTPTPMVDYLVREALAPLVREQPAAGIERLRVVDIACGSGHFLVGAARFLGRALHVAYRRERGADPPPQFHPQRALTAEVRARWDSEGEAWCKRRIVERCLFGVDLNPAAVQLAQVALWIESLAGDRPLSFFAHHVRCGNSLLGSSLANFDRPPHPRLDARRDRMTRGLFEAELKRRLEEALAERRLIDAPLPPEVRADTPEEYAYKEDRLRRAESATAQARLLLDLRSAAAFVPAIWRELPALMSSQDIECDAKSRPWWREFGEVRERERFFHWELEFPEVFAAGGFDCVLGNPPWEKVKPDRKEFYGRADVLIRAYTGGELDARIRELHREKPGLAGAFDAYAERMKTLAAVLKGGGDYRYVDWEVAGRATGGDPDLFKFFVERAHALLKPDGRLGYLVPSAIYNNEGCTGLRHLLLDEMQIERFYGFENRQKIFEIDSRYKFVCLVARKSPKPQAEFPASFMRHELAELESGPPAGVQVIVRKSEIERLSPGTLAFLEYRGERDRELVLKMYGLLEGRQPRPLLGDDGPGSWKARFYTQFHMTNDRGLWTRADGRLYTPREICGLDWPARRAVPFAEVRAAMAEKGFWPLYEGKHIDQFMVDVKPVERWVNLEAAERQNGKLPDPGRKLVFRDIASNTNERTCIAAVLPEKSCSCNTLATLDVRAISPGVAAAAMNSFAFDFITRLRTAGTHLNWTYVSRVAVPSAAECRAIEAVETFSVDESQATARDERYFQEVWRANRATAEAYGLTADDLAYILGTFPVFARKRPEFMRFLLGKLSEIRR